MYAELQKWSNSFNVSPPIREGTKRTFEQKFVQVKTLSAVPEVII